MHIVVQKSSLGKAKKHPEHKGMGKERSMIRERTMSKGKPGSTRRTMKTFNPDCALLHDPKFWKEYLETIITWRELLADPYSFMIPETSGEPDIKELERVFHTNEHRIYLENDLKKLWDCDSDDEDDEDESMPFCAGKHLNGDPDPFDDDDSDYDDDDFDYDDDDDELDDDEPDDYDNGELKDLFLDEADAESAQMFVYSVSYHTKSPKRVHTLWFTEPGILYALGYLFEHREEADYHDLTITLRSILFSIREGVV